MAYRVESVSLFPLIEGPRVERAASGSLLLMGDQQQDDKPQSAAILWARYSGLGFIIPASVFVGWLLGKLLDYWLHTHWLFLVGIIVGAIAGFVDVIRTVLSDKDLKSK